MNLKPPEEPPGHDPSRTGMVDPIDQRHDLVRLMELIDWAIPHSPDSELLHRARMQLVDAARKAGISLHQG